MAQPSQKRYGVVAGRSHRRGVAASLTGPRRWLVDVSAGSLVALAAAALARSLPALLDLHGSALLAAIFALPAMVAARAYPLRTSSLARLNPLTALTFGLVLVDGGEVAAWTGAVACLAAGVIPGAARREWGTTLAVAARLTLAATAAGAVLRVAAARTPLLDSPAAAAGAVVAALTYSAVDAALMRVVEASAMGNRGDEPRDETAGPRQFAGHYVAMPALGTLLAGLYEYVPFMMPLLLFPLSILYLVLKSTVSAQDEARQAFEALADEVDRRSPTTAGHSRRVALLTERCTAAMPGVAEWERQLIIWCARIHDVGNKYIAPSLADRAGPLDERELDEVQRHALYGASLLASAAGFRTAAKIIRHHHENLDGTGYPDHLQGGQIPIGSRIIRVAESLDAMLSQRAYRPALSFEAAVGELRQRAGTWFDPVVVDAMLSRLTPSDVALVTQGLVGDGAAPAGGPAPRAPGTMPSASSLTLG